MRPLAVAHRGDPHAFRENTLPALEAAAAAGADMVETDLRRTADGAVAILHDATLKRLWDDPRACADLTLAELGAIGIPALADVLEAVPTQLMLDYKDADVVEPAVEVVQAAGVLDRVVFAGGNVDGHRRIRELEPRARIALTWEDANVDPRPLLDELGAEFFNPSGRVIQADPGFVRRMHDEGTKVSVWTLDRREHLEWALDLEVDAVITNRIGLLLSLLAERQPC